MNKIKRALISVWDKKGILGLAKFLRKNNIEIISTGGTKKILEKAGIPVLSVSSITNQKEIMNGRVKTLHPNIFGGILANKKNKVHISDLHSINGLAIDMVIINLYPFENEAINKNLNIEEAIEYIDIGGPAMLRAAAKNYSNVIPICSIKQYDDFIKSYIHSNGNISLNQRLNFAREVFSLTKKYDNLIFNYLNNNSSNKSIDLRLEKKNDLRYGENPHQKASFYLPKGKELKLIQLCGKKLSYNNYFDVETAISIVYDFQEISCAIIKHSNPCGFAIADNTMDAYLLAVSVDPISYFGGIVAFNNTVNSNVAYEINKSFLECIVAPEFTDNAIKILKKKNNLRILCMDKSDLRSNKLSLKSVFNGYLIQEKNISDNNHKSFINISKLKPKKTELKSLYLSWKLVKYVKSNAIIFSNETQLLGVGAGQMSRIDSTKIAIMKAKENGLDLKGSIMASDAFFPFPDCIQLAAKAGIKGVIQPGGSINDKKIIKEINRLNMFMVITNKRQFSH